jgi:IS605 OrfB family transposase
MKTKIIKIYPTSVQKKILDQFINTYRFVYNRTLEYIKKRGHEPNFIDLRNILATERTKSHYTCYKYYYQYLNILKQQYKILPKDTDEIKNQKKESLKIFTNELILDSLSVILKTVPYRKNDLIHDFELFTSNEIRSNAIKNVCDAYKSAIENLKQGNIKFFDISFKKRTSNKQTIELATTDISYKNNGFQISPSKFPIGSKTIKINKRDIRKLVNFKVNHNCDLVKTKHGYYIHLTVDAAIKEKTIKKDLKVCGIDPGLKSLLTIYGNKDLSEIDNTYFLHKNEKYNNKIDRMKKKRKKRYKKKQFLKYEKRKNNLINEIHWKLINYLVKEYDILFFGDIKSHNITKGGKSKYVNRLMNDVKFYKFKQRLHYKCVINNTKVFFINEAYTTQCCSSCGNLWREIGTSREYKCKKCYLNCGRDYNAAKNIYMKGIENILSC